MTGHLFDDDDDADDNEDGDADDHIYADDHDAGDYGNDNFPSRFVCGDQ